MKRSAFVMGLVFCLAVVLAAGTLSAREPVTKGGATAPQGRLPDFTIDKIYLTKDCRVAVVVKNLGPGVVPDEVWTVHTPKSAGVYLYRNGTGWGGASIWKFDPAKHLKSPGGTATYVSTLKVTGAAAIKAVVDLWDVVPEANEGNNSLEVKLTCEAQGGTQLGPDCNYTVQKDGSGQVQYVLTGQGCGAVANKINQQPAQQSSRQGGCKCVCELSTGSNIWICRCCTLKQLQGW